MKAPDDPRPSGDRRMARLLIRALTRAGLTVEIASRFASFDPAGDAHRQRRLADLGERIATTLIRRYQSRAEGERPILWFTYHLYHKAPDWLGPAVSRALGIPYVVAEASHAAKQRHGPWAAGYAAAGVGIAAADLVFNINPDDAPGVRPLLAAPARLIALAPFIDVTADAGDRRGPDARRKARAALARRCGFANDGTPLLLCVAMMRPGDKLASYRCLGRSLALLRDRPWRLLIVGDGPARAAVATALAPLGRRVFMLGLREGPALAQAYDASDLHVWPAVNEAYGMALLEAQAAGLPVVAGRSGGVAGVVAHGRSGLLVPLGEPQALAAAVKNLLVDTPRRAAMAGNARRRVRRDHDLVGAALHLRRHLLPLMELGAS